uniref:Uncharacterized protein n=1 Tax=Opuntia streptacantha TaxID=393608 RepID=A0A7C9F277_OPUST
MEMRALLTDVTFIYPALWQSECNCLPAVNKSGFSVAENTLIIVSSLTSKLFECINLKAFKASAPLHAAPIRAVQETTSGSGISSNTFKASNLLPHLEYIFIMALLK